MQRASVSGQPSSGASYVRTRIGLTSVLAVRSAMSGPAAAPCLKEIGGDGVEDVRPTGKREAGRPADQDPPDHALAAEPSRERLGREQHLDEARQEEPEGQLQPHAAQQTPGRGHGSEGQAHVARDRHSHRGDDQREENPGAGVHPSGHAGARERAVRYSNAVSAGASASRRAASISR